MSEKIVHLNEEVIKGQIKELVRGSVEETLNGLLEAEAQKLTQAARYERSEERQAYRSGHYQRNLTTTSGEVSLNVPRLKGVTFETAIIERYRRRESSVEEALIEMYLAGVSVRRVEDITEALWGSKVSPSTISELNKKAYVHIEDWRNRPLQGGKYPYVYVDGIYLRRNWGGEYENVAILVAIAVNEDGYREVLGAVEGMKEDKSSWTGFFQWLKGRGLEGVKLVVGDKCLGMLENIYANEGNMTEGADGNTIDGMGMNRINGLIEKMKDHSYQPNPARRTYIEKKNGKLRPLGIPSIDDKLVQEIVRMILESIYDDSFSASSHGFRPNRSCHTALKQIKCEFTAVKWFIEGDIKSFFDCIDHQIMVALLRKKIQDEYFLALIWKFLKAGYLEDWVYHKTYSGTPQGSVISPILSNIYLNEFDKYMENYKKNFDQGKGRTDNPEYRHWEYKLKYIRHKKYPKAKWKTMTAEEKKPVTKYAKELKKQMHALPYSNPMDESYKRLVYVRYADDWLCGVIGSKEDAEKIKSDIKKYLAETLKLELSEEKTLITHSSDNKAKFLGYEIYTTKDESIKRHKNGQTRRTRMGRIQLYVPKEKWLGKLLDYGALQIKYDKNNENREIYKPVHRNYLVNNDDLEILMQYNSEIRGFYNYYRIADNVSVLNNFFYVMKFSLFKTYGRKYQKRIGQIRKQFGYDKQFGVEYETKKGKQKMFLYNEGFTKQNIQVITNASVDNVPSISRRYGRSGMIARLKANRCEYCGATDVPMEIHHVKKLKNLKGKKNWERHMIAMKRKTMVLCLDCHQKLHAGKLD